MYEIDLFKLNPYNANSEKCISSRVSKGLSIMLLMILSTVIYY